MTTPESLLTVGEVARICRVNERTVRRHIASGKLRAVRVGRNLRVRRPDLKGYLAASEQAPVGEPLGKPFSFDAALWDIVGMCEGTDDDAWVSSNELR